MDWLNRDTAAVDRYQADPRCGFRFTLNGYDSMFRGLARLCDKKLLAQVPKDLPVLFCRGGDDPVGDKGRGVCRAAGACRRPG